MQIFLMELPIQIPVNLLKILLYQEKTVTLIKSKILLTTQVLAIKHNAIYTILSGVK